MSKKKEKGLNNSSTVDLNRVNWVRHAHTFLLKEKQGNSSLNDINLLNDYVKSLLTEAGKEQKTYKVGLMFIAVNPSYWQYAKQVIDGVRQYFLPGHETEIMLWTDMQNWPEAKDVSYGATVFPIDQMDWPYPTLMRYHFFLKQEEYLKKFDYIFYLDLDMRVVNIVGDEIFGQNLTMARHPMYQVRQNLWYPYEPNPASSAYIKQPGKIIEKDGQKMFQPVYAAGGFQGGTTESFLEAMHAMQESIDADLDKGYIARWNDESHWNKYLYEHGMQDVVDLDVSYIYPDSMINEYYKPIWGRDYTPRIITLTKPFSTSKEGGAAAAKMMNEMKGM